MPAPFSFGASMKRFILAVGLAAISSLSAPSVQIVEPSPLIAPTPKRRKVNKTTNKINVFMGYASYRKGKGQKKREATIRKSRGWK